jgi:hypothetical protein
MPANINDLSRVLGRLEADASAAKNQRELIFTQLDQIKARLGCLPQLAKTVESHSAAIDDYKRLKQRGIGIALALTTIGGAIGSIGAWVIGKFMLK